MKRAARLLALAMHFSVLLLHAESPQIAVSVLPKTARPQGHAAAKIDVFSGTTAKLRVTVEAPIGTTLTLKADLMQVAHGLAVPLVKDLAVANAVSFTDRTRQVIEVSLAVPEVQRVTPVRIQFHARSADSDPWQPAGDEMLIVYPQEETGWWRRFFAAIEAEPELRLTVFGESPRLRAFLRGEDVPFHDVGTEPPAVFENDQLYLGESKPAEVSELARDGSSRRVILFINDPNVLAGVYTSTGPGSVTTKVTLPLLDDLATDPRSRQTFSQIIQQTLNSNHQAP